MSLVFIYNPKQYPNKMTKMIKQNIFIGFIKGEEIDMFLEELNNRLNLFFLNLEIKRNNTGQLHILQFGNDIVINEINQHISNENEKIKENERIRMDLVPCYFKENVLFEVEIVTGGVETKKAIKEYLMENIFRAIDSIV